MILDAEIFYDLLCNNQHQLGVGLPTLQKTRLGWIVSGTTYISAGPVKAVRCNFVATNTPNFGEFNKNTKFSDDDTLDCERVFQTHSRSPDGNFVVNLSLKNPVSTLGHSKPTVYKRFKT